MFIHPWERLTAFDLRLQTSPLQWVELEDVVEDGEEVKWVWVGV